MDDDIATSGRGPSSNLAVQALELASDSSATEDSLVQLTRLRSLVARSGEGNRDQLNAALYDDLRRCFQERVAQPLTEKKCPAFKVLKPMFEGAFKGISSTKKVGLMLKVIGDHAQKIRLPDGSELTPYQLSDNRDSLLQFLEMILDELRDNEIVWCDTLAQAVSSFLEEEGVKEFQERETDPSVRQAFDILTRVRNSLTAPVGSSSRPETQLSSSNGAGNSLPEKGEDEDEGGPVHPRPQLQEDALALAIQAIRQTKDELESLLSSQGSMVDSVEKVLTVAALGLAAYALLRRLENSPEPSASTVGDFVSSCVDQVDGPALQAASGAEVAVKLAPIVICNTAIRLRAAVRFIATFARFFPR